MFGRKEKATRDELAYQVERLQRQIDALLIGQNATVKALAAELGLCIDHRYGDGPDTFEYTRPVVPKPELMRCRKRPVRRSAQKGDAK